MWGGTPTRKRKLQKQTSKHMKAVAKKRRCPRCKRGNALGAEQEGVRQCRYCGWSSRPKKLCNLGVCAI